MSEARPSPEAPSPNRGRACSVSGCEKAAKRRGFCWAHLNYGPCHTEDCTSPARRGGLCWLHRDANQGACQFEGCDRAARRGGLCWGHVKHRQDAKSMAELAEPRGAARDRAELPRRSISAQLVDAAIDLADANAEGDKAAFERALARLRMASLRHGRESSGQHHGEQHPHTP